MIYQSTGLKKWADRQNLQTAASSYAEARNLKEFREKIERKKEEVIAIKSELSTLRQNRKDLMEIQYYLSKYKENVGYRRKYDEAMDKEKILQSYEEQLALFDLAKEKLQGYGIIPNIRELDRVTADLKELEQKESELEMQYEKASAERDDLKQKYRNIMEYLGIESPQRKTDREVNTNDNHRHSSPHH